MNFTKKLIGFTLINFIIFYLATMLFPEQVVFGNELINPWQAMVTAAFGVMIAHMIFEPIAEEVKFKHHHENWLLVFFFVNAVAVYFMGRTPFSLGIGIGIQAFWVAIFLGLALDIGQYIVSLLLLTKK